MFQTLGFPAGGRQIDAKGNFFRYESCNAAGLDETIRVRADGNDLGTFLPGDYVDLGSLTATRWNIIPETGTATGTVRVGNGSVGSSRLTGNVRVIDQGADKTLSGRQFLGVIGGTIYAGLYTIAGVRAVGRAMAIKRLQLSCTVAGAVVGVSGTGVATVNPTSAAGMPNKLIGGAVSTTTRFGGTSAAQIPTTGEFPGASWLWNFTVPAGELTDIPLTTPIVIPAGSCLAFVPPAVNTNILIVADFEE